MDQTTAAADIAGPKKRERLITVCDACFQASCWHGDFMCERAWSAGTVKKRESELRELAVEHPSYYSKGRIDRICGGTEYAPI